MAIGEPPERPVTVQVPKPFCPKTLMNQDCTVCHTVPSWKLKEAPTDEGLIYPIGVKIYNYGKSDAYGYYELGEIDYSNSIQIKNFFDYLRKHQIKKASIEILSGGGSLFIGWRIKALIDEWIAEGNICETRVRGIAASAAFIVFCAGSKGHRIANSTAELMMHELRTWQGGFFFIKETTPASAEEEAKVFKHLQDTISRWLATRGKLPKQELDERLKWKEFWMTGRQAKDEYGFADIVIGE